MFITTLNRNHNDILDDFINRFDSHYGWRQVDSSLDYKIDLDDVFIKPNHRGKAHPKDRWGPFAKATLSARDVRVDTNSPDAKRKPFIHHSVVNRITDVIEYRPKALKGVDHTVIYPENKQNDYKGIVDHIAI